jgi:hypothetical protein
MNLGSNISTSWSLEIVMALCSGPVFRGLPLYGAKLAAARVSALQIDNQIDNPHNPEMCMWGCS